MSITIGYSSELYFVEPQDILKLAAAPSDITNQVKQENNIIVLLGNKATNSADTLVCGKEIAQQAIVDNVTHVPVKFVFLSNIAKWNILAILFRKIRYKYKFESNTIYHTTLTHLRNLHIERGFRNAENAYDFSKRWYLPPEQRIIKYNNLRDSLKANGFNDKYPITIMLCRRYGVKDSVDDGHHRIGICVENNIEKIAIRFNAAGTFSHNTQKICLKLINFFQRFHN